ncbi:phosphate ABC transporter substrate-binding protein PstS [Granulicoccus sp. GXG6511]|uniref:phosphate ABC transporter substrate-binding protein PstS n=1 Tax=Granulicoccus sp. GXG6511 TaxID=3381351 RepID=UPI003D7EF592
MKILPVGASLAAAFALVVTGCAANETPTTPAGQGNGQQQGQTGEQLQGQIQGTGASSMQAAQEAWIAKYREQQPGVTVNYAPEGSGAGRTAFINGGAAFAGSDRALKDDEMGAGKFAKCTPESNAMNLPVYVSPIAVVYNVEGVDELKLDAATLAAIFKGEIKNWNDPKIAALNEGVTFPDQAITPVHRSDNSGTTENFTDTLEKAAGDAWGEKASGDWPAAFGGEAAKGTSGVVAAVRNGNGTIGYADESQTKGMNTVQYAREAGGEFVGPTAEAAAQVVAASPKVDGRADNDHALNLDRTAAGYPFVLVAYAIVCEDYQDETEANLVKDYIGYITSEEGQKHAEEAAGSAPLASDLAAKVKTSVDSIK